jgi:hypothetical protein
MSIAFRILFALYMCWYRYKSFEGHIVRNKFQVFVAVSVWSMVFWVDAGIVEELESAAGGY